ncbi:MAG: HD domain-containing protein [Acidimicrobiia bacterium]
MRAHLTDLVAVAVAAVVAVVALPGTATWWLVVFGAVAFAVGPRFQLRGPGGSRLDLLLLVGAAVPFLFPVPEATLGMLAVGIATVRLSRLVGVAPPLRLAIDVRRVAGAAAYASVLFLSGVPIEISNDLGTVVLWGVAALTWFAVEVFFRLVAIHRTETTSLAYVAGVGLRDLPLIGSLMAAGAAFGLVWQFSDPWVAVVVGAIPFQITFASFRRYDDTRTTYGQTIRALARIPEVGGLALEGHADRTARVAVRIGKEMGLAPNRVQTLEYAALMHDIGRITLTEPSIVEHGYTEDDIARWSSEIIAEADYLTDAAHIVQVHHNPYRRPGQDDDPEIPIEARIVKVASAYDRAVHDAGASPLEALELLHRGTVYDYDPVVVRSLRTVLEHRSDEVVGAT